MGTTFKNRGSFKTSPTYQTKKTQAKNFVHPFSADYFNRIKQLGADVVDKKRINDLIIALNVNNLWYNLSDAFLLRSSHNMGTGTSVISLKNLLVGTMTNGPTWGANGISFASSPTTNRNSYITVNWRGRSDLRENSTVCIVSNFGEQDFSSNFQQHLLGSNGSGSGYAALSTNEGTSPGDASVKGPTSIATVDYATAFPVTLPSGIVRMWTLQRENNLATNSNSQGNKMWRDTTQIANGSNSAQAPFGSISDLTTNLIIGNVRSDQSLALVGEISVILIFNNWSLSTSLIRSILQSTVLSDLLP